MRNIQNSFRAVPVTLVMVGISILITLVSNFGKQLEWLQPFFITEFLITSDRLLFRADLPEIQDGQIWRVFTPAFIHFSILHIVFNMMWLWDLGRLIEEREGKTWYIILLALLAALSNIGQFYSTGPNFGGMSGVVYGLLGYLWIRGKCDPSYGMQLRKEIVVMMLIWFVVCLTGLVGNIGNMSHGVGLVVGMLLGWLTAKRK